MEKVTALGKWLFILPFTMYVLLHFGKAQIGAAFVPKWIPFPLFWDYFTGVCILAFMVSCLIGKFDKLATLLMALYVFLMILLVHIPRAASNENDLLNIFRNTMVVGGLLLYARYVARDKRLTG
ncbi:DoxX family protein [Spirosoma aerolatum]|uniref:hypothetical protein n=1 Tax=Spirosoma aerolatum TaxID=1211326 RepID=UPI0009AF028E|nr:hypothetical protein [Spirosoma aerolatum]